MPITEKPRTIAAGDDIALGFTVTEAPAGATLDGATIKWWAAPIGPSGSIGPPVIQKSTGGGGITITDVDARKFVVEIDKEDTEGLSGNFRHEAEVTDAFGKKSTVTNGVLIIAPTLIPSIEPGPTPPPPPAPPTALERIDAEIAALEQARTDWLTGKRKGEVRYESSSVRFGGDFVSTYEGMQLRLRELRMERAKLTGEPSGVGPTRFTFGGRA